MRFLRNQAAPSFLHVLGSLLLFGVLVILVIPMVTTRHTGGTKKTQAKQEILSIAAAVSIFWNDYEQLPIPEALRNLESESGRVAQPRPAPGESAHRKSNPSQKWILYSENILRVLTAAPNEAFADSAWHDLNPKRKVYLSLDAPESRDPWGGTYAILLVPPRGNSDSSPPPRVRAQVRSAGPNGYFDDPSASNKPGDDISNF
jgi:hypothetical protein